MVVPTRLATDGARRRTSQVRRGPPRERNAVGVAISVPAVPRTAGLVRDPGYLCLTEPCRNRTRRPSGTAAIRCSPHRTHER